MASVDKALEQLRREAVARRAEEQRRAQQVRDADKKRGES